ncbi:hypothetical protein PYJP_17830 [Pyrofollis japonicus]|nr:hypothetical protein PYJP_17830 [Pyrofollis japonicus]
MNRIVLLRAVRGVGVFPIPANPVLCGDYSQLYSYYLGLEKSVNSVLVAFLEPYKRASML